MTYRLLIVVGGLVSVALLGALVFTLIKTGPEFQAAAITIIGAFGISAWNQRAQHKREIESRHFAAKRQFYGDFVRSLHRMILGTKTGKAPLGHKGILKALIDFKMNLLIWGDEETINQWLKLEASWAHLEDGEDEENPHVRMAQFDGLLRQIRKDLGKNDVELAPGSLVALFLKAKEHEGLLKAAKDLD